MKNQVAKSRIDDFLADVRGEPKKRWQDHPCFDFAVKLTQYIVDQDDAFAFAFLARCQTGVDEIDYEAILPHVIEYTVEHQGTFEDDTMWARFARLSVDHALDVANGEWE